MVASRARRLRLIVSNRKPAGTQGACDLGQNLVQVGHMFQHIYTNHGVKAGTVVGQRLTHTHIIPDPKATLAGMGAGGVDRLGGGVDAGDIGAPLRKGLGHEAPGAAKV